MTMATPSVVEVDRNAPQIMSPIKDYGFGTMNVESRRDEESRRRRNQAVDMHNYNEMRAKYQEAKLQADRMREECAKNRRMLLEMSSVINCLKHISVDYEHDESAVGSPITNVQKKIRAIEEQLRATMTQCGNLEQEKEVQSSTIKAQVGHILTMEEQIGVLQDQLKEALEEKQRHDIVSEKETLDDMNRKGEVISMIRAQEEKIAVLEEQVRKYSLERNSTFDKQIEVLKGSNEAKYLEIQAMEKKLTTLRSAQNGHVQENNEFPTKHVSFTPAGSAMQTTKHRSSDHSSSRGSSSLASISEETSTTSNNQDDLYQGHKGNVFSSRSFSTDDSCTSKEDESRSIKIAASYEDDSVEVMISDNKAGPINVSDVSYTTEESTTATPTFDSVKEYNKAMSLVDELRRENRKLRQSHSQALSDMAQVSDVTSQAEQTKRDYHKLSKTLEEQKQSFTLVNIKYEKLRREYAKMVEDQKEERAKYAQLMEDYGKISCRQVDLENYDNLKELHNVVVMKMADLGEENEALLAERNEARTEKEQANSKARALSSELEATNTAYQELQKENDDMSRKVNKLSGQCDSFKTKYYELLASDETIHSDSTNQKDERYEILRRDYEHVLEKIRSLEAKAPTTDKLKRDYSEAQAKIAVLEQSNKELEAVREQYHKAEAKVSMLERDSMKLEKAAKTAKKREEQRALHLKDMLSHYKTLEKEHDELNQKLKRLQAVLSEHHTTNDEDDHLQLRAAGSWPFDDNLVASERRIKELQQQRDNALEQMAQLEDEICQVRLERVEATKARHEREHDIKVVLGHYRDLQKKHDELLIKTEELESELLADATRHTVDTELAVLVEKREHEEVQPSELFEPEESSSSVTEKEAQEPTFQADLLETAMEQAAALFPVVEEESTNVEAQASGSADPSMNVPGEKDVGNGQDGDDGDTEMESEMPDEEDEKTTEQESDNILAPTSDQAAEESAPEEIAPPEATEPQIKEADGMEDAANPETEARKKESEAHYVFDMKEFETLVGVKPSPPQPEEAGKMEDPAKPAGEPEDDSVARLLHDMEALKQLKVKRSAVAKGSDMSTVSNVSEGVSLDNSEGTAECSHSALSDEAPSTSWKDIKIAKLLGELEQAKSAVWALEEKEKSALADLEITERKLLVATRETGVAKKRKNSRIDHLRDTIAQQKRLESEFKQVQERVTTLQEQLNKAKTEARLWEEETKTARKRATSYHNQFKKLQQKHKAAMKVIEKQGQEIELFGGEKQ